MIPIDAPHVSFFWPVAKAMLEPAVTRGTKCSIDQVLDDLVNRRAQLWLCVRDDIPEMALVTVLTIYPSRRVCQIAFAGGQDARFWVQHLHTIEEFAEANDCTSVEWFGRRGWGRLRPDYLEQGTVYSKEIA